MARQGSLNNYAGKNPELIKPHIQCDNCGKQGHIKSDCYAKGGKRANTLRAKIVGVKDTLIGDALISRRLETR